MLEKFTETKGRALFCPSVLSADFANLSSELVKIADTADWVHLDMMDGHFVPNLTFGPPIIKALRSHSALPFDCHLMVTNPADYIGPLAAAGVDGMTVHYETVPHLHRVIQAIKASGMSAGVVLNPATPVQVLEEILPDLDMVLLMSVNPGFGGQKFISSSINKIIKLRRLARKLGASIHIQIDGGIGLTNVADVYEAGADAIVAGSAVFGASNPAEVLQKFAASCPIENFARLC